MFGSPMHFFQLKRVPKTDEGAPSPQRIDDNRMFKAGESLPNPTQHIHYSGKSTWNVFASLGLPRS